MNKAEFRYDPRIVEYGTSSISKMTANSGDVYFEMTPGTAPASADNNYLFEFLALSSTTVFANVAFTGASSVTMTYADGKGNTGTDAYNATSNLASGTSYQCRLSYTPTSMTFFAIPSTTARPLTDEANLLSIDGDVDWGQDPLVRAFWGGNSSAGANGVYTSTTFSYPTMNTYKY